MQCVILNKRMQTYYEQILSHLSPSSSSSSSGCLEAVDYKRQKYRGTLKEGVNFYFSSQIAARRLLTPFSPYSEKEQKQRQKYKYQRLDIYTLTHYLFIYLFIYLFACMLVLFILFYFVLFGED